MALDIRYRQCVVVKLDMPARDRHAEHLQWSWAKTTAAFMSPRRSSYQAFFAILDESTASMDTNSDAWFGHGLD